MVNDLQRLNDVILKARERFTNLLSSKKSQGGFSIESYQRYLSMQYHLTKDVQRYFITAAAHHDLAKIRDLRKFLVAFANEEELHYLIAGNDLRKLGVDILPVPFDVTLWHSYFGKIVIERPFVRIGAATILENLADESNRPLIRELLNAPFLNKENTKFLVLHMHEQLPHGPQLISALTHANLLPSHWDDIIEGAKQGCVFYLRMAEWSLDDSSLSHFADIDVASITEDEQLRIDTFSMDEL